MIIWDHHSQEQFQAAYSDKPLRIRHGLTNHPLLTIDALVDLAGRLPSKQIEYNRGDVNIIEPEETLIPRNGLTIEDTLLNIEDCGSWACFHNIEADPAYRKLVKQFTDDLAEIVHPITGKLLSPGGFIYVSSPNAVTPIHLDPEYNILFQIRGNKEVYIFPQNDELVAPPQALETYYNTGLGNMDVDESIVEGRAECFPISAEQAVYIPLTAPHWVKTGPQVSISLSIIWRSESVDVQRRVYNANYYLRKMGFNPDHAGKHQILDKIKSFAWRCYEKTRNKSHTQNVA